MLIIYLADPANDSKSYLVDAPNFIGAMNGTKPKL